MMTNHITAGKPAPAYSHAQFERATQLLSDEHRVIERVLNVLEELTRNRGEVPLQTWKKALEFVRGFADQCHHLKEEKLLFPTLEEHGIPSEGGPVGMMLMEHEEGRSYVRSMLAAVEMLEAKNEGGREALLDGARAYVRLLREHIQKEDDVLFRMADEIIPAARQKELLRAFEEHETEEMGTGVHEKYLAIAEELEASVA
jgi:hemerythrin-like domain-containing protein